MASESEAASGRTRQWLLITLGIVVGVFVLMRIWPANSATLVAPASNQVLDSRRVGEAVVDPADLDVRLEALSAVRPAAGAVERNPFRFQPKAVPPPPRAAALPPGPPPTPMPAPPAGPPQPPPIPLKFIGLVEKEGLKVAAMSDCRTTFSGTEGQIIDGRYRLVRIGVESLVLEYVDGRGRTTVRLEGCPPR